MKKALAATTILVALLLPALFVASAQADEAEEVWGVAVKDELTRTESPLSNESKWVPLNWSGGTVKAGRDTTSGWGPSDAFSTINGAYWYSQSTDASGGDAVGLTVNTSPGAVERYVSVWLNMPNPGGEKSGYQLRWTMNSGLSTYAVKLSKWVAGTETVLASEPSVSIPAGTRMMLSDSGGTVTAWKGTTSGASLLSASDSTFSYGYGGIEASGNISRSKEWRMASFSKAKLTNLPLRDNLQRSENPLSNGGKWSKPASAATIGGAWNTSTSPFWLGYGTGGLTLSSAYWNPETYADGGEGVGVTADLTVPPTNGQWEAVYLDGGNLGNASLENKYEVRWTGTETAGTYTLDLAKVAAGARTVLVSRSAAIAKGDTIALTEKGGNLVAWTGNPPSPMLIANDSSFSSGYAGMSVYGGQPTADNFRAGELVLAPAKPTVSATAPASPANDNAPEVKGTADAGSTVQLFTNSGCTGSPVASGSATTFGGAGITASVADNTTTTFYANATNTYGASPCSTTSVTYVEDSAAPAAPTVSSTNPASPANNNAPKVVGSAESGSTVKLYTNSTCTSAVAATGTAAAFASPGITVSVADNTTTTFYATATDAAGNVSPCSTTSVTYKEVSQIYWGAWLGGNAYGSEYGDGPWDSNTWNKFEEHAGKKVSIVHFGQPAPWNQAFAEGPLKLTRERGAIPLMDMDPDGVTQKEIVEGKKDSYFKTWATAVKNYGYPLFFRWEWEMNGTWFQWGSEVASNPTLYKEVWWHLHKLFEEQGASNITWVWCPNLSFSGSTSLTSLYPGDEYVDWTCLDGYNFGTNPEQPDSWKSFSTLYTTSYTELLSLAPTKPIMIGEMASTEYGGEKSAWITDTYGTQLPKNFPKIKAVVWYNKWDGAKDWPIETSASAQTAFKNSIASSYYAANSFGSLPKLTKIEPLP